jgi:hypothetical protein
MDKRTYETPKLVTLGTVADLTRTGLTNTGSDFKGGSVEGNPGR